VSGVYFQRATGTSLPIHALSQNPLLSRHRTSTRRANVALNDDS